MFVLEPFGLREERWDASKELQEQKNDDCKKDDFTKADCTKYECNKGAKKKQGRPDIPDDLALQLC